MGQESLYMKGSEEGAHLVDIRELDSYDPILEMQQQINDEIDEGLETKEQLRRHQEDRARLKKIWGEIMAKNYKDKNIVDAT